MPVSRHLRVATRMRPSGKPNYGTGETSDGENRDAPTRLKVTSKIWKYRWGGITAKTALLSWLVTIGTLLIFVLVIVPEQKSTFLENLNSKAAGVSVSLYDVASGAVVRQDYSAIVDHCVQVLKGDPTIDFLVLTRLDGFSLIHDRSGWHSETLPKDWNPSDRSPRGDIRFVPLFHRRVFHYSAPFDYCVPWGWIHVGLSLAGYDRSVATVYQRTLVLTICCIVLSLVASVIYAKRLVRPILSLRTVVQKVAGGDLTAYASVQSGDEVESLANSFNAMTEALQQRDRILQSVRFAAQQFLSTAGWQGVIPEVAARIGEAAAVSHICIGENCSTEQGNSQVRSCYKWINPRICEATIPPAPEKAGFDTWDFGPWADPLKEGHILSFNVCQLESAQRRLLELQGLKSVLLIPIIVEKSWWGVFCLAECRGERNWTPAEQDSIRAVAEMLGAAVARQRTQDALVDAKATLEIRVRERTRQLQEQVLARERAHTELAEAQQRLMEASRLSGMAEIATGVLHNVGNVLNSVNVSTNLISDRLRQSKLAGLNKADTEAFLSHDPKGKLLPSYLIHLADHWTGEQAVLLDELTLLSKNVQHIKDIVATQQSYATVSGIVESLPAANLLEDAIQMNAAGIEGIQIKVIRDYDAALRVTVDLHKTLQILVNLLRNARHALNEAGSGVEKQLRLAIKPHGPRKVRITVQDNGVGIKTENLTRIFSHGFTTKKNGHGFGLHLSALAAQEMGGSLTAQSDGPGTGATFILDLPSAKEKDTL
jgi:two-component system NtrC family sensor kinase